MTNVDPLAQALAALVLGVVFQYMQDSDSTIKRCVLGGTHRGGAANRLLTHILGSHTSGCAIVLSSKELREIIVNLIGLDQFLGRLQYLREAPALKSGTDLTQVHGENVGVRVQRPAVTEGRCCAFLNPGSVTRCRSGRMGRARC